MAITSRLRKVEEQPAGRLDMTIRYRGTLMPTSDKPESWFPL